MAEQQSGSLDAFLVGARRSLARCMGEVDGLQRYLQARDALRTHPADDAVLQKVRTSVRDCGLQATLQALSECVNHRVAESEVQRILGTMEDPLKNVLLASELRGVPSSSPISDRAENEKKAVPAGLKRKKDVDEGRASSERARRRRRSVGPSTDGGVKDGPRVVDRDRDRDRYDEQEQEEEEDEKKETERGEECCYDNEVRYNKTPEVSVSLLDTRFGSTPVRVYAKKRRFGWRISDLENPSTHIPSVLILRIRRHDRVRQVMVRGLDRLRRAYAGGGVTKGAVFEMKLFRVSELILIATAPNDAPSDEAIGCLSFEYRVNGRSGKVNVESVLLQFDGKRGTAFVDRAFQTAD